jgi:putative protease
MKKQALTPEKPELLAPAGSLESFFAAMEKGADAVYAGLKEFSARAKAKNFTLYQMEKMTGYAQSLRRKLYVTLNTIIKEPELPLLVDTLSSLEAIGVNGVIIQDMAVARLVREFFPSIPLHASTQMTVHNSAGVLQLAELGFERVVLARELHIDEISRIVSNSPIAVECFVHGALCFSISGQCYFSSFLGGHSGNRGRCAQPCRRQYRYKGKEGYYFSTNDFSSIDMIPQMAAAGVKSLKIEGRMKSAEYVASIVGAYRKVLDAAPDNLPSALVEARELIKLSFGRVPTKGFLASHSPADIATPSLRGATGRFLGEIRSIRGNRINFESRDRLHIGDRIRIQPKSDMAGKGFTVREIFAGDRPVKSVQEKTKISVTSPFQAQVGDAVFKVSSETAFTLSENACIKRLETVKTGKIPCDLKFSLKDELLTISADVWNFSETVSFPLTGLEPSRTGEMEDVLKGQFAKSGETCFILGKLSAEGFPSVMIPPAALKELKRQFYQELTARIMPKVKMERALRRENALASIPGSSQVSTARRPELVVRIEKGTDLHLLHRDGVDAVALPLSRANLHQLPQISRRLRGKEEKIIWRLPFMIFDHDMPWYSDALNWLLESGFNRFEAANIAHFRIIREQVDKTGKPAEISTDYRLFSLNTLALLEWKNLGASASTLYIEDDAENLSLLLSANISMLRRIVLHCEIPAITSKIAIKSLKNDAPVLSDRGDAYRVTVRDGLTQITPVKRFSITQFRDRLQAKGCGSFIIDLSNLEKGEQERVLSAYAGSREIPETSPFNFLQGLV